MGERRNAAALARQGTEAQRGEACRRAAVGFQQFSGERLDRDVEGRAVLPEVVEAGDQRIGRIPVEPVVEIGQGGGFGRQPGGAVHGARHAVRHGFAPAPDQQQMGFGGERRLGLVQAGFKLGDAAAGLGLDPRGAAQGQECEDKCTGDGQNRTEDDPVARQAVAETGAHVFSGQSAGMTRESAPHPPRLPYSQTPPVPE